MKRAIHFAFGLGFLVVAHEANALMMLAPAILFFFFAFEGK
jgi:hypothetical protein